MQRELMKCTSCGYVQYTKAKKDKYGRIACTKCKTYRYLTSLNNGVEKSDNEESG